MSRPARSWSATTIECASVNCSRYQGSIIAVSRGRPHMFIVYQRGRGHEPVTVAGSIRSLFAVNAICLAPFPRCEPSLRSCLGRLQDRGRGPRTGKLDDLDAVPVRVVDVETLAPVVRPPDHGYGLRRPEGGAQLLQPLVFGIEVVGDEAEVGAARLVEPAGAAVAARLLELEQLEVHAVPLEVDDADARDGNARDPLDEAVRLHFAVGD